MHLPDEEFAAATALAYCMAFSTKSSRQCEHVAELGLQVVGLPDTWQSREIRSPCLLHACLPMTKEAHLHVLRSRIRSPLCSLRLNMTIMILPRGYTGGGDRGNVDPLVSACLPTQSRMRSKSWGSNRGNRFQSLPMLKKTLKLYLDRCDKEVR